MKKRANEVYELLDCGQKVYCFSGSKKDCEKYVDRKTTEFPWRDYRVDSYGKKKLKL